MIPTPPATMPHPSSVAGILLLALDLAGPAILRNPDKLRERLAERSADSGKDVELLLTALHEGVPQTLLEMQPVAADSPLIVLLQARLRDRHAFDSGAAEWAVRVWSEVLALWFLPANARPAVAGSAADDATEPPPTASVLPIVPEASTGAAVSPAPTSRSVPPSASPAAPDRPDAEAPADTGAAPIPETKRGSQHAASPTDPRWAQPFEIGARNESARLVRIGAIGVAAMALVSVMAFPFLRPRDDWLTSHLPPQRSPTPLVADVRPPAGVAAPAARVPAPPMPSVAPLPPRIVDIDVPGVLTEGKAAELTIRWQAGTGEIASIERRVTPDADGRPSGVVTTIPVPEPSTSDHLTYPIDTGRAPSRLVEEFTLIARDGQRSEPRRVTLTVPAPVAPEVPAPPARAIPAAPARPVGPCGSDRCGSVVWSHPVPAEKDTDRYSAQIRNVLGISAASSAPAGQGGYDVLVRMDGRTERTFRRSAPIPAGARVRVDGLRLSVVARP